MATPLGKFWAGKADALKDTLLTRTLLIFAYEGITPGTLGRLLSVADIHSQAKGKSNAPDLVSEKEFCACMTLLSLSAADWVTRTPITALLLANYSYTDERLYEELVKADKSRNLLLVKNARTQAEAERPQSKSASMILRSRGTSTTSRKNKKNMEDLFRSHGSFGMLAFALSYSLFGKLPEVQDSQLGPGYTLMRNYVENPDVMEKYIWEGESALEFAQITAIVNVADPWVGGHERAAKMCNDIFPYTAPQLHRDLSVGHQLHHHTNYPDAKEISSGGDAAATRHLHAARIALTCEAYKLEELCELRRKSASAESEVSKLSRENEKFSRARARLQSRLNTLEARHVADLEVLNKRHENALAAATQVARKENDSLSCKLRETEAALAPSAYKASKMEEENEALKQDVAKLAADNKALSAQLAIYEGQVQVTGSEDAPKSATENFVLPYTAKRIAICGGDESGGKRIADMLAARGIKSVLVPLGHENDVVKGSDYVIIQTRLYPHTYYNRLMALCREQRIRRCHVNSASARVVYDALNLLVEEA
ncbi:hypothetical protein FACS1894208_00530 [Clostridia bacterium]|nr:hypothetical protein FACS1894208_00530 [Clostridia bacterium]